MEFNQQLHYSPHIPARTSVSRVMLTVLLALLPGIATYITLFGWGVLVNLMIAAAVALLAEGLVLALRRQPVVETLMDGSALLTAVLLALALPPHSPWWLVSVATGFAIVFAKQLYGGLGNNPFNPAMAGYVVALISFPLEMTRWNPPLALAKSPLDYFEAWRFSLLGELPERLNLDAISQATPLDTVFTRLDMGQTLAEIYPSSGIFGHLAGNGGEWVSLAFLAGGLYLLAVRLIDWRIPLGMLAAVTLMAGLFWLLDADHHPSPLFHLLAGATMLGAFFIATDPVSACTTPLGRWIFGAGCGLLVYVIRSWGGYPDAVAFAVLLMNMAAPLIDYYTQPRIVGAREEER